MYNTAVPVAALFFFSMQWFIIFLFRSNTNRMQNFFFYITAGQWSVTQECINVAMHGCVFKYSQTSIGVFLYFLNVMSQQSLFIRAGLMKCSSTNT